MKFKKILNYPETITHTKLKESCEKYESEVYTKIRIADILPIENSGIDHVLYRYALQAHFDFVITNINKEPLFAVEYDGPIHYEDRQVERDNKKRQICEIFNFPLLRVNGEYLVKKYRGFDLLSWLIEVWFFREVFINAQENGSIPDDELFDPHLLFKLPGRKGIFPLWLSLEILTQIQELAKAKKIKYPFPNGEWIGIDDHGNYHGIIWLWIDEEMGISAQSAMRSQNFPIVESDLLTEILVFLLYEELSQVLSGKIKATPIKKIVNKVDAFTNKFKVRMSLLFYVPSNDLPKVT